MTLASSRLRTTVALAFAGLFAAACAAGGGPDTPARSPAPAAPAERAAGLASGVYTAEQAEVGGQYFNRACADCHSAREFSGTDFAYAWDGSTVGRLVQFISETMPEDDPGGLTMEQYLAVTAYVLQLNDYPAGPEPLVHDPEFLETLRFGADTDAAPAPR